MQYYKDLQFALVVWNCINLSATNFTYVESSTNNAKQSKPQSESCTLQGKLPSFFKTSCKVSDLPSRSRWKTNRGSPVLLRTLGFATETRGRFPSPLISKKRFRPFATLVGRPSTVACKNSNEPFYHVLSLKVLKKKTRTQWYIGNVSTEFCHHFSPRCVQKIFTCVVLFLRIFINHNHYICSANKLNGQDKLINILPRLICS